MRNRFLFVMAIAGLALGLAIVLPTAFNLPTGMIPVAYADDAPPPDDKPVDTPDADKPVDDSADKADDEGSGAESDDTPDADKPVDTPDKPKKKRGKKKAADVPADKPEAAPAVTEQEVQDLLNMVRAAGDFGPNYKATVLAQAAEVLKARLAEIQATNAKTKAELDATLDAAKAEADRLKAKADAVYEEAKALRQSVTVTAAPSADRTMAADRTDKTKSYGGRP